MLFTSCRRCYPEGFIVINLHEARQIMTILEIILKVKTLYFFYYNPKNYVKNIKKMTEGDRYCDADNRAI